MMITDEKKKDLLFVQTCLNATGTKLIRNKSN